MKKQALCLSLILIIGLLFSACGSGGAYSGNNLDSLETTRTEAANSSEPLHLTEVPAGYVGIYTVDDLINSGANESGNYILMNDLDLSSISDWKQINNRSIFDGNNYTIFNLSSSAGGLFESATQVLNLNLEEVKIDSSTNAGGIADSGNLIRNCSVSGTITATWAGTGGIAGVISVYNGESGGIIDCVNKANINIKCSEETSAISVGGICGSCYSELSDYTISNCENYGQIRLVYDFETSMRAEDVVAGGICGRLSLGNIAYSSNYGDVFSNGVAGGILGAADADHFTVESCYNAGNISGTFSNPETIRTSSAVGGIVGYTCTFLEDNIIENAYNVGTCGGTDFCGGIVGNRVNGDTTTIRNCAYSSDDGLNITGSSAMFADNKAMTRTEMQDLNNYPFNNKDTVWQNGTGDYIYPVFQK